MEFFQPENSLNDLSRFSSVAMLFNGFFLEDRIKGYETLKISGREVLNYQINNKSDIPGRNGSLILDKTLPERVLTITYRIMAEDNEDLQNKFRQLNKLLDTNDDVPIKFRDDLNFTFYGQVKDFGEVADDTNNIVSTFSILCSDPYKYKNGYTVKGNPVVIKQETYSTNPDLIKIKLLSNTNSIVIANKNTDKKIILNGNYYANQEIEVNINNNGITKNGQNIMKDLAFEVTDFHGFTVNKDDEISVTPSNSKVEMLVRSKWK